MALLQLLVSCILASSALESVHASLANLTLLPLASGARALDGSPYGFYFVKYSGDIAAHSRRWTISIQGGGWCVGEADCYGRSQMKVHDGKPGSLGSSTPFIGQQHGCGCMNTNGTDVESEGCNCLTMLYLDGGSFSGNRDNPVPVSAKPGKFLHYKGLRNLDATLEYAFAKLGLDKATELVVTGGSAGGLSTFLHVDRIARRMQLAAPDCTLTTAAPVVGFFLDHANYQSTASPALSLYPHGGNYSSWMKIVYEEMNITVGALLPDCLAAFPREPHLCFMSPHMVKFVKTPYFLFNSRFDAWQMDNDLQVPCHAGEAKHKTCSPAEQTAIVDYGADFITALQPVIDSAPKNGAFITTCLCHGCPWSSLTTGEAGDSKSSYGHYAAWHHSQRAVASAANSTEGQPAGPAEGVPTTIHIDRRAPNGGGDIKNPECVAFP